MRFHLIKSVAQNIGICSGGAPHPDVFKGTVEQVAECTIVTQDDVPSIVTKLVLKFKHSFFIKNTFCKAFPSHILSFEIKVIRITIDGQVLALHVSLLHISASYVLPALFIENIDVVVTEDVIWLIPAEGSTLEDSVININLHRSSTLVLGVNVL